MIIRRLKDRLANKFNISIAETDYQEKWQRAQFGIAQVGSDYVFLEKNITKIFDILDNQTDAEVVEHTIEYL